MAWWFTCSAHGQVRSQSDALKAFLFRAVQELLFNVVKHARVKEATNPGAAVRPMHLSVRLRSRSRL